MVSFDYLQLLIMFTQCVAIDFTAVISSWICLHVRLSRYRYRILTLLTQSRIEFCTQTNDYNLVLKSSGHLVAHFFEDKLERT